MKSKSLLMLTLCFSASVIIFFSLNSENKAKNYTLLPDSEQIIFFTNSDNFSPVIVLQADANVTWTWADSTTSNSTTPAKNYHTAKLRKNYLKVTPWSALRRINIGYDAQDGGSEDIEFVDDQRVSLVENLSLVAPYLKEWCSSYNHMDSLDFSNFTNIETIECFRSRSLRYVNLDNTPKLKRACFEENGLEDLNLSGSPALVDLRGALNNYHSITFSNSTQNIWHLCVRDNPQITSTNLLNDLSAFPQIAELFIWNTNQQGNLVIPSTNSGKDVIIQAYKNQYSSIDLRGALRNTGFKGRVEMSQNNLSSVDISGCIQITHLDLSNNELDSEAIEHVLKQVDDFGTYYGTIDLRQNKPPTAIGLNYITNLRKRGWTVATDEAITGNIQNRSDTNSFNIYHDLLNDKIKVELGKVPDVAVLLEVRDISGVKLLHQVIFNKHCELSLKSPGIYFFTLRSKDWVKTRKFILYK